MSKDQLNKPPQFDENIQDASKEQDMMYSEFLGMCEWLNKKPTQERARYFFLGDENESMSIMEEPIPDWYWELPKDGE